MQVYNLFGRKFCRSNGELHSRLICFLTKSRKPLILNQTPKKQKEVVIGIRIIEIEGTLFKKDKAKSKVIGEGVETEVRNKEWHEWSLINLGNPDVSMGWSWMQIIPNASHAEAAAIYAALTVSPCDSEVTIYTDSQTAIDGLYGWSSSFYSNSRLYYKTTNFELWANHPFQELGCPPNQSQSPFQ
ncbi:hypothetical protein RirG_136890 [Rhizophagus irregularis DAOM 197198w]|uniref:RNase H type-1 domain-containing protein n=1 Tax=Rhizophagus irregularis (strain DAOM 197198w) TaxID=1432141 RepID=A0A015JDK4_RHIIW|nr:hypothetical protein RirG_136890 [Rhizophagus irregularis DAOM 197198w]